MTGVCVHTDTVSAVGGWGSNYARSPKVHEIYILCIDSLLIHYFCLIVVKFSTTGCRVLIWQIPIARIEIVASLRVTYTILSIYHEFVFMVPLQWCGKYRFHALGLKVRTFNPDRACFQPTTLNRLLSPRYTGIERRIFDKDVTKNKCFLTYLIYSYFFCRFFLYHEKLKFRSNETFGWKCM